MSGEEPREQIEEINNNEEPVKEAVIEPIIEEEEEKTKLKPKASRFRAKPTNRITKEPVEVVVEEPVVEVVETVEEKLKNSY